MLERRKKYWERIQFMEDAKTEFGPGYWSRHDYPWENEMEALNEVDDNFWESMDESYPII